MRALRSQRTIDYLQVKPKVPRTLYPLRYINHWCLWSMSALKSRLQQLREAGVIWSLEQEGLRMQRRCRVGMRQPRSLMVRDREYIAMLVRTWTTNYRYLLLTQAFRIRWSSNDWYASYRKLSDSSTTAPWSLAYLINLFEATGTTDSCEELDIIAGRRKGNEPVGEAWLFEEMRRWSIPAMFMKVYFR